MNRPFCTLITLAASVCVAPIQALANDAQIIPTTTTSAVECAGAAHLSYVHGRVAELATQGIGPLRQFLLRTRMIYQLDLTETVAWIDQRRALLAACEERSARADPVAARR